ncbi:hypothetical protein [Streptococcus macacae]|uniref:Membrane protein n=1 Tax=Streptococcus macacae NCTC 11558 TaxID=764298 RepID=G5JWD7_9STRE|nr:hypothetical protein [Streptococcus macacae]EHJ52598.1 putative membrane protein [Streptococcus macacae NCTC 11558]SUN77791.1 membrane protein [Streptococcus macacae NCTC 11558]
MTKTKKKTKVPKNTIPRDRYHGPLITGGVSLGYIKFYPWLNLPFSIFFFYLGLLGESAAHLGLIKILFLTCIIINAVSILFSFFHSLVNRFKSLAYVLIALVSWTTLLWIDFIGLMMFVSSGDSGSIEDLYVSPLTLFYVIPMLLLFFLTCGFYAWHYLPQNQGKVWKINQWETYGGKAKGKKKERLTNFGAAFGVVLFVPAVLTGYIANAFGVFLGILLTSTLSAVIVDAFYAAVYIRKHPEDDSL